MKQLQIRREDSSKNMLQTQQLMQATNLQYQGRKYGFFQLFRFADKLDYVLMAIGTIFGLIAGATYPIFALLWGDNIDNFKTPDDLVQQTYNNLLKFIYIGLGELVFGWIMVSCWAITGERQSIKCKNKYLQSLLSQQVGWYECSNQYEITSTYSVDSMTYQIALGHSMPFIINIIGMSISGIVIAFVRGWLMCLALISSVPAIVITKYIYSKLVITKDKNQKKYYAQAGGRAQQALFSIKTVKMLNGEKYQSDRYHQCLQKSRKGSPKFSLLFGIGVGGAFFFILCTFAFGLWYGSNCIRKTQSCPERIANQVYSVGIVFTVFFSIVTISFYMSHLPYNIKKVMAGLAGAQRIFRVIDREPKIKSPINGIKLHDFKGLIRFNNVTFSYPKDPKRVILNGLNLQISKKKIALVGQSGCGKSTIIQLLLRFYDPDAGEITVDGVNLKDIDLAWWRQEMIGYVGQEPVLFATTIKENLLFSALNSNDQQLTEALKKAEVFDFVNGLEKKLDTYVGSGGCQVSGGQKQRIAIARAIIRKPKILILDQATSALDRKTEKSIQSTLNQISQDTISITIAHRTKTIMNSDQIFVIDRGTVKQSGRFEQLKRFQNARMEIQNGDLTKKKKKQKQNQQLIQQKQQIVQQPKAREIKNVITRLLSYYKSNYLYLAIVIVVTAVIGAAFPVSTIFLANLTEQMLTPQNPNLESQTNNNTLIVFLIAVAQFIACVIQSVVADQLGQRISTKIRLQTFNKLLKLPIYWHDKEQNKVSALTEKLFVGTYLIRDVNTTAVIVVLEILLCMGSGIVIAFIYEWRLALVQIAFLPINFITAGFSSQYRNGDMSGQKQQAETVNIISEAVSNIRTVYSLGYEKKILKKYSTTLQKPFRKNVKRSIISGFFYGLGEAVMFVLISVLYHIGALFVKNYNSTVKNVFTVIFAMFFATTSLGQMVNVLPNIGKCIESSKDIFKILDSKDEQQIQIEQNSQMIKDKKFQGKIQLKNIRFRYPTRPTHLFNGLNLDIEKGKKVAFVGSSGCGKSTILSFLLRFYEPESGQILLDGINIKDFDIHHLRSQFGVVSQQPVVFNSSFKQNIQYNMSVSNGEIVQAAQKANALNFIYNFSNKNKIEQIVTLQPQYSIQQQIIESKFQLKKQISIKITKLQSKINTNADINNTDLNFDAFNRSVGVKGSEISGGQKQRVAIARAILRKPQILLLDEATSALDAQNQKKVSDCLDKIMEHKTSINIAHRLETIANSDLIYVFEKGALVEKGTYNSLLQKKGYFYNIEKGIDML